MQDDSKTTHNSKEAAGSHFFFDHEWKTSCLRQNTFRPHRPNTQSPSHSPISRLKSNSSRLGTALYLGLIHSLSGRPGKMLMPFDARALLAVATLLACSCRPAACRHFSSSTAARRGNHQWRVLESIPWDNDPIFQLREQGFCSHIYRQ